MPDHYRPLSSHRSTIEKKVLNIEKFTPKTSASKKILEDFGTQYNADEVLLFKLEGTTMDANVIILDKTSLKLLGYLKLDPWFEYDDR